MSDTKGERPLRTATARDARSRVLLWIEQYIRANKPGVGEALPAELEIARSLRVGRSSVREALSALKVLGIVQSRRKGGIRVIRDPVRAHWGLSSGAEPDHSANPASVSTRLR